MKIMRAFICPLCGEPIEAMTPEQTLPLGQINGSIGDEVERLVAANVAANEAVLMAHFDLNHTLREAMVALGQARQALMEIRDACDDVTAPDAIAFAMAIEPAANRGLGGK